MRETSARVPTCATFYDNLDINFPDQFHQHKIVNLLKFSKVAKKIVKSAKKVVENCKVTENCKVVQKVVQCVELSKTARQIAEKCKIFEKYC
uniref:Saposin B-type domain-containing protein n=1 Tax=Romanomermis culicivorax TaxID=13658 RepID=A0A915HXJ9_ROMCU